MCRKESMFTSEERERLDSEPLDMMPCNRYTASYFLERRVWTEDRSVRSLDVLVMRELDESGRFMSVIVRWMFGDTERRTVVREWPMKPPAPVIRMVSIEHRLVKQ